MVPVPFILLLAYVVCLADGESYPGSELDISSVSEKCLNGYPTGLLFSGSLMVWWTSIPWIFWLPFPFNQPLS